MAKKKTAVESLRLTGDDTEESAADPRLIRAIDRALSVQRPAVLAHIRGIRKRHPQASPEEIVRILEKRYVAAVTTGGAAVGATAVIPAIGTAVTLALAGAETVVFLEATALYAQSVAEVHGIAVEEPERARALVMTMMLGREGSDLVRNLAGQATGGALARNAYWGEMLTSAAPRALMGPIVDRLKGSFLRRFAVQGGTSIIGKALPFGIGAVVGGAGNNILSRKVVKTSREAFGTPPTVLPAGLEPTRHEVVVEERQPGTEPSHDGGARS